MRQTPRLGLVRRPCSVNTLGATAGLSSTAGRTVGHANRGTHHFTVRALTAWAAVAMVFSLSGCTSFKDYVHSGFKVGPNYCPPKAPVAQHWIDASDKSVRTQSEDLSKWWTVFNDATLNGLIANAYRQNLTLKEAGFRILEARAQLGIARGEVFPQVQDATGGYLRSSHPTGAATPPIFSDSWNYAFNLQWELDFWGRFRRAVTAADDQLQASVEGYDAVLVTLLGDVAANYVQVRTFQEQIELAKANVELQRGVLKIVQARLDAGRTSELDVDQAQSTLSQTEAQIPAFKINLRQARTGSAFCWECRRSIWNRGLATRRSRRRRPTWSSASPRRC